MRATQQQQSVHHEFAHHGSEHHDDIVYPAVIPFVLVHIVCFAAIWTGVSIGALVLAAVLYFVRMWAITAGFHRYFSHRSYKTSRAFQFVLAFVGQTSAQRGVIWWAALHRHHHKHSDTPDDVHSALHGGFLHSHVGWIFKPRRNAADYGTVPDLTRYPELRLLNRNPYFPAFLLAIACFAWMGWVGLVVGFFWSTVVLYHGTFAINSLAHVIGKQRYVTGDESRNNLWLALITLGEGWHNNHHAYQSSTRQGFRWWEIDVTYYVLWAMSKVRLVWDLRAPPAELLAGRHRLGRKVVEKAAQDLVSSLPTSGIAAGLRERWVESPGFKELASDFHVARTEARDALVALLNSRSLPELPSIEQLSVALDELHRRADERLRQGADDLSQRADALRARIENARTAVVQRVSELPVPELPTLEELKSQAASRFRHAPSLDEIAERARELLLERVVTRLLDDPELSRAWA